MTFLNVGSMSAITLCVLTCYIVASQTDDDLTRKFPIIHCYNTSAVNHTQCSIDANASTYLDMTYCFHFFKDSSYPQVERICSEGEAATDLLFHVVGPTLLTLLCFSFLATLMLQYLSNYHNIYNISKTLFTAIVHPSVLVDLLDDSSLNEVIQEQLIESAGQHIINFANPCSGDTWYETQSLNCK